MDFPALRSMSRENLSTLLSEKQEELRKLRFKVGQRQLNDIRQIRDVKKTIAQILTLLHEHA